MFGLCAASSGCASPPATPPPPASAQPVAAAPPGEDEALAKWLDLQAVHTDAFGRRVLYTWTSRAQVDEAARTGRLLMKRDGDAGQRSIFDASILHAYGTAAQLSTLPAFQRRRFAWSNPWATSRGFGDESYGDALVRVVLKPGAILGRIAPEGVAYVDLENKPFGEHALIKNPERLAAVYHVAFTDPERPETIFREYVLVNESQIEGWSVATPEIRERLELDVLMLRRLARAFSDERVRDPKAWARGLREGAWPSAARTDAIRRRYEASLAFPTPAYHPTAAAIEAIAARLEALVPRAGGAGIVRESKIVFDRAELAPGPGQKPPCIRSGSMCLPIGP